MFRLIAAPLAVVAAQTPAAELAALLLTTGWIEGPPPHHRWGAAIDAKVCRFRKCSCGRRGLKLRTFYRRVQYIGLAECPACGLGEEG